jgi:hypothetical protein
LVLAAGQRLRRRRVSAREVRRKTADGKTDG